MSDTESLRQQLKEVEQRLAQLPWARDCTTGGICVCGNKLYWISSWHGDEWRLDRLSGWQLKQVARELPDLLRKMRLPEYKDHNEALTDVWRLLEQP